MDVTVNAAIITAVVSVVIAIIAAAVSIYQSIIAKKNNADTLNLQRELAENNIEASLISKARIEWIQKAREATVEFLSECLQYLLIQKDIEVGVTDNVEMKSEIDKGKIRIKKYATLLILYFGSDGGENDKIVKEISQITEQITTNDDDNVWLLIKEEIPQLVENVEKLRDTLRSYYKKEWIRVSKIKKEMPIKAEVTSFDYDKKKDEFNKIYKDNNYSLEYLEKEKFLINREIKKNDLILEKIVGQNRETPILFGLLITLGVAISVGLFPGEGKAILSLFY